MLLLEKFNRGIPWLNFHLPVNHKRKFSLLILGIPVVRMVRAAVLTIDTLALVAAEHAAFETLTVSLLALAILAVAASGVVAAVDLRLEGVKLTLEDFHDGIPAHFSILWSRHVLAGGIFCTVALGSARGVVPQALTVALETEAFATLAALALGHSRLASLDLGKQLLLGQGLRHYEVELVFQLALVELGDVLSLLRGHLLALAKTAVVFLCSPTLLGRLFYIFILHRHAQIPVVLLG